jgi:hypothetical protein
MKICPVCNDSFADQLSFCDIDGARLTPEGSAQERNKWWSLLGAGLLLVALVITAASMFFLPKARVSTPIVDSEPQVAPAATKPAMADGATSVAAAPRASVEPEDGSSDAAIPEVKKKERPPTESNSSGPPNPKAAALAAEETDKKAAPIDVAPPTPRASARPETPPSAKGAGDPRPADANKAQPTPDLKKDQKTQSATAKGSEKDSNDKKTNDEKDKKKGGFLRVFKKIFGKG